MNAGTSWRLRLVTLALAAAALGGCGQWIPDKLAGLRRPTSFVSFNERLLASLPQQDVDLKEIDAATVFSPDGTRVAYVLRSGKEGAKIARLFLNGVAGIAGAEGENVSLPAFSFDGKRYAHWTSLPGKKEALVVDGQKLAGEPYDEVGAPQFSARSARWICPVTKGKKAYVLVDGARADALEFERVFSVALSPDGKRLSYVATQGEKKTFVVTDGAMAGPFDSAAWGPEAFSPDGRRTAYWADKPGGSIIVVDGRQGSLLKNAWGPTFSPNGKRVAYVGQDGDKTFAVLDGVRQPGFASIFWLTFSPDSRRLAYVAQRGEKNLLVVDGVEGEPFDSVGRPVFSPDSRKIAHVAKLGEQRHIVLNGRKVATHEDIWWGGPVFSPDSRRMAFIAKKGQKWRVVLDGREGREFERIWPHDYTFGTFNFTFRFANCLTFSPDSSHLAYVGFDGSSTYVVVDQRVNGPFDNVGGALMQRGNGLGATLDGGIVVNGRATIAVGGATEIDAKPLAFSPDGRRLAFGARLGRELRWKVVDLSTPAASAQRPAARP